MQNLQSNNTPMPRTRLISICQNLIRKDLEIFYVRDHMVLLFGEIDFNSRPDDEFLSLDFTLEFAFGKKVDELDDDLVGLFSEILMNAAFFYRRGQMQRDVHDYMARTAEKIVQIIFTAAQEVTLPMAGFKCVEEFHKYFPNLDIPFVNDVQTRMLLLQKKNQLNSHLTNEGLHTGGMSIGG
ncbi:MAG: hypothetical protein A2X86_19755 [Bdellovibrionales bacterium GWA2_49_15]|nr:MAG: hypothetical protein A2X86_19755 [Bdellovibrionales bacterium GWA2_49_15]HAZ12495.1 hypothetical protein [Bdellovibrionales bacterium]